MIIVKSNGHINQINYNLKSNAMKKVILLLALGLAVTFVNAQDNTKSTTTKTTDKQTTKAGEFTKTPVKTTDLSKAITDNLSANYKDYKVISAFKLVKSDVTTYAVNVEKGTDKLRLIYDADGKFIRKKDTSAKSTTTTNQKVQKK